MLDILQVLTVLLVAVAMALALAHATGKNAAHQLTSRNTPAD